MAEEKSMTYTIILGVCMLLCLLMIGRMLLGRPASQSEPAPYDPGGIGQEDGEGMTMDEQTMRSLLAQAVSLPEEQLTVRIGADATISVAVQVARKQLQDSGFVPGSLRTALLFLPEQCRVYGAWHADVQDGDIALSCTEAKFGNLSIPDQVSENLTAQLAEAVNNYLAEQGCRPQKLDWEDGSLNIVT